MVASGAVCGDAFPGNGLPVRGLWSLIPVLVAFPVVLYFCAGSGVRFRRVCTGLTKFNRDKIVQITEVLLAESGKHPGFYSTGCRSLTASVGRPLHASFDQSKY